MPVGWVQTAGSTASWHVATDFYSEGMTSLRSDVITHNQTSSIEVTGTYPAGVISFDRRVDSETNFDFLRFYIDGVQQGSWSGFVDWYTFSYPVTAGTHTFKWAYTKNGSVNTGADAAWIDNVIFPRLGYAAYIGGATVPWADAGRAASMTQAFGAGNWFNTTMAAGVTAFLPQNSYSFIFLDGSDSNAIEFANYLQTNQVTIETWVSAGGHLFINSAPNQGANISLGFGGVQLLYGANNSSVAVAYDATHAVFLGPNLPLVTSYTGGAFSHAMISGAGVMPILVDSYAAGNIIVGEKSFGAGHVIFGTMTASKYQSPVADAANLWANI
ncbi:MAG: hypothetical protein R8L53_04550, partial [Mariprofundales bacterium]